MVAKIAVGDDAGRVRLDKTHVLASVSKLAADHGVRVLAAGGPVFAAQGLISPSLARSAAVLVDIASFREFLTELFRAGWTLSPLVKRRALLPSVVLRLRHTGWVVELDLYTALPGFYVDPQRVFAILWARRRVLTLHSTKVFTLDRLSTVIMAVHDRVGAQSFNPKAQSYQRYHIEQFCNALTIPERVELLDLVRALGAVEPVRPLLNALGLDAGEISLPTEVYARWRLSVDKVTPATLTVLAFAECPPPRRLIQTLRVLRQSPSTVARAILGAPYALWQIFTARRRMVAQYHALQKLGQ